jgi:hypothetical protein
MFLLGLSSCGGWRAFDFGTALKHFRQGYSLTWPGGRRDR